MSANKQIQNPDASLNKNKYLSKGERSNYFNSNGETHLASKTFSNPVRSSSSMNQSDIYDKYSGIIRTSDTVRDEPTYMEQGEKLFNIYFLILKKEKTI